MYSSVATDDDQLAELLAQSRSANRRNDATGMLLYHSGVRVMLDSNPPARQR